MLSRLKQTLAHWSFRVPILIATLMKLESHLNMLTDENIRRGM